MAEETRTDLPGSTFPDDPERAREEIRRTRERMSGTIDEIEEVLVERKERVKARLDVASRFRENPLPALGAVLAAGLLLGLLTGGRSGRSPEEGENGLALGWRDRAGTWEARSRRLLRVAREQEDEIADLRASLAGQWFDGDELDETEMAEYAPEEEGGPIREAVSGFLSTLFRRSNGSE
jgi:ElaB/YqjD/DUF883 family membrane-anchored ribosome-binding protein